MSSVGTLSVSKIIENVEDFYNMVTDVELNLKLNSKLMILIINTSESLCNNNVHEIATLLGLETERGIKTEVDNISEKKDLLESNSDFSYICEQRMKTISNVDEVKKLKIMKKEKVKKASDNNFPKVKKKKGNRSGLCVICGKVYVDLRKHKETIHERKSKQYKCPLCGLEMEVIHYRVFYDHKQECEAKITGQFDRYVCEVCGEKFPTLKTKTTHGISCKMRNGLLTRPKSVRTYVCHYEGCDYKGYTQDRLDNHINRDHLKIPIVGQFSCDECTKKYTSADHLKKHKAQVHCSERNYGCDVCGARFSRRDLLKKHSWIHADFDRYICPYCEKGFKQQAVLYRHKKTCPRNPDR